MHTFNKVTKNLNSLWTRLFDHRGFVSGEIQYFLREFEEKRKDKEVELLFSILMHVTDIKATKLNTIKHAAEKVISSTKESLNICLQITDDIIQIENKTKEVDLLEESRKRRKAEKQNFMNVLSKTCRRIDNTFEQKEEELEEFYKDLERRLNLSQPPIW